MYNVTINGNYKLGKKIESKIKFDISSGGRGGLIPKLQDYIHLSCHASKTPPDPQLSVQTLNCRQNLILHHPIFHENPHFQG